MKRISLTISLVALLIASALVVRRLVAYQLWQNPLDTEKKRVRDESLPVVTATPICGEVCTDRILVKLTKPVEKIGLKNIQTFLEDRIPGPVLVSQVGSLNVVSIEAPGINPGVMDRERKLGLFKEKGKSLVDYIEPDAKLTVHTRPNDPYFANQWGLFNEGQTLGTCGLSGALPPESRAGADINVLPAWSRPGRYQPFVVAVLDTGMDLKNPDLENRLWSAPQAFDVQVAGKKVHCEAGSHGFNAITNLCDPNDVQGHGTSVAAILGATGDNGLGTVGVYPEVSIIAIKAFDETGGACVSQVVNAIDFLVKVKQQAGLKADIRIVNNSYGMKAATISPCKVHPTCKSRVLAEAVGQTTANGILFVASDGNSTRDTDCVPEFPAGFELPNIVSVAASTNRDGLARFSNFGLNVDLVAPGTDICAPGIGGYSYKDGTSMAAPFVSGAAALLLSRCGTSLTYVDLKRKLRDNADLMNFCFRETPVPGRRLNVGRAVLSCGP